MSVLNDLSAEIRQACDAAALRHHVSGTIDPNDWIFRFIYNHHGGTKNAEAIDIYFSDGADCAAKLYALIAEQRPIAGTRILEFAAGYGRVTRHLRNVMPEADVLACDIHPEAISFLREKLGAAAVGSVDVPEKFNLGRRFDVVFALSFFSHLPQASWRRWLIALAEHVAPDGFLLFTTHGERSRVNLANPKIGADGFWFKPVSEQQDLPGSVYGSTITLPAYVFRQVLEVPSMRLVRFQEGFWWGHQDIYVLRRDP